MLLHSSYYPVDFVVGVDFLFNILIMSESSRLFEGNNEYNTKK